MPRDNLKSPEGKLAVVLDGLVYVQHSVLGSVMGLALSQRMLNRLSGVHQPTD